MTPFVDVRDLVVRYGPAVALDGVSLRLHAGERVALVGANGAGKSSLLNAVCGVVRPAGGEVRVGGDDVSGKTPNQIVRRGLTQVPEGRQVFPSLPVEANLLLGAFGRSFRTEIVTSTIRYLRRRAEARERLERIYGLLPKLYELRDRPAGRTSGGGCCRWRRTPSCRPPRWRCSRAPSTSWLWDSSGRSAGSAS